MIRWRVIPFTLSGLALGLMDFVRGVPSNQLGRVERLGEWAVDDVTRVEIDMCAASPRDDSYAESYI